MKIGPTLIEDTFAEAFGMRYTRLIVTAEDRYWVEAAAREFTGYSASVIACDAETGVETTMDADETPDGRPGMALMAFGFSPDALAKAVANRTGQCLMTCPTTAVFNGLTEVDQRIPLGRHLRFFGDGFQKSKQLNGIRYWRVPVMDGEFVVEESLGIGKGVAGGNLILQAVDRRSGLQAARQAATAIQAMADVVTPFPGGVVRSGSKVGSRYQALKASTADAYCPTLRGRVESKLHAEANCAYEIVIDGASQAAVGQAMRAGMHAAAGPGTVAITAGNYGGKLGKFHLYLRQWAQ